MECDSVSNAPKCPLHNGVSIVQKLLSNSPTLRQQVEITLSHFILTITNAKK